MPCVTSTIPTTDVWRFFVQYLFIFKMKFDGFKKKKKKFQQLRID